MRNRSTFTLALLLAVAVPTAIQAQGIGLGVHGGFDSNASEMLLGASVGLSLPGPISFSSGFDLYPGFSGGSLFVVDFDAMYAIPATGIAPYVGVGLFVRHVSLDFGGLGTLSGNNAGFNLNGGLGFGAGGPVQPFVETKLRVGDGTTVAFRGGLKFKLGR